jgi:oxygen-independent coproporphyrinogen III oxidase
MQSANPEELRLLGRIHDLPDLLNAVQWARLAGFDNLNLDLIFGLPDQSLESWQKTVAMAIQLNPEHLSLYALTIEEGTLFGKWADSGLISLPDDDLAAEMYEWADQALVEAGYRQYEISNWARTSDAGRLLSCQHNLQYWRNQPYLGFGAGAHGSAKNLRYSNCLAIGEYIQKISTGNSSIFPVSPACEASTDINRWTEIEETMMLGLRLVEEGVDRQIFMDRFGRDVLDFFPTQITRLIHQGLIEITDQTLRLSSQGRLLGNQVFVEFIGNEPPPDFSYVILTRVPNPVVSILSIGAVGFVQRKIQRASSVRILMQPWLIGTPKLLCQ